MPGGELLGAVLERVPRLLPELPNNTRCPPLLPPLLPPPGGELLDAVLEKGHYSEDDARTCFLQIMRGIMYLHSRCGGNIHCGQRNVHSGALAGLPGRGVPALAAQGAAGGAKVRSGWRGESACWVKKSLPLACTCGCMLVSRPRCATLSPQRHRAPRPQAGEPAAGGTQGGQASDSRISPGSVH